MPLNIDGISLESGASILLNGVQLQKINCNGVKVWENATQISVTVYGAVSETVTLTSSLGTFTIKTNTAGTGVGTILAVAGKTTSYTVTGSISGYSRTVSVTTSTTTIYAMPDGALYWHGNKCTWNTGGVADVSGWIFNTESVSDDDYDKIRPTFNANSMYFPTGVCTAAIYAPANMISLSGWSKLKARVTSCTAQSNVVGHIGVDSNTNASKGSATKYYQFGASGVITLDVSSLTAKQYIYFVVGNAGTKSNPGTRSATVTEFWLE